MFICQKCGQNVEGWAELKICPYCGNPDLVFQEVAKEEVAKEEVDNEEETP